MNYHNDVREELIKMGYNISNKGTSYLIECICLICNSVNYIKTLSNLDKNVYEKIAEKYKINLKTLKSNIQKATQKASIAQSKTNNLSIITPKITMFYIVDKIKN